MSFVKSRYNSKAVVMATQHDKGKLVAPHFNEILAMSLNEVLVDTDSPITNPIVNAADNKHSTARYHP